MEHTNNSSNIEFVGGVKMSNKRWPGQVQRLVVVRERQDVHKRWYRYWLNSRKTFTSTVLYHIVLIAYEQNNWPCRKIVNCSLVNSTVPLILYLPHTHRNSDWPACTITLHYITEWKLQQWEKRKIKHSCAGDGATTIARVHVNYVARK